MTWIIILVVIDSIGYTFRNLNNLYKITLQMIRFISWLINVFILVGHDLETCFLNYYTFDKNYS